MRKRLKALLVKILNASPFLHGTAVVLLGYLEYAKQKRFFGGDCVVCASAFVSTGDYYFSGLHMRQWAARNHIDDWIFLSLDAVTDSITKLFRVFDGRVAVIGTNKTWWKLVALSKFCAVHFNYWLISFDERGLMDMSALSPLLGYKGMNILDVYLLAMNLPEGITPETPEFDRDPEKIDALFAQTGAVPGKTVLIAPYATTSVGNPPPPEFWRRVVDALNARGYSVLTNCAGNERPLPDTQPLLIPYALSAPFLDAAGGFIGIRSGLCDIISTTMAKKIILHPYEAQNWPDGTSLAFTGLNRMGLCDDAIELEAAPKWGDWEAIAERILEQFE
jgi:hypothetical protein